MTARVWHAPWVLTGEGPAVPDGAVVTDANGSVLDVGPAGDVLPRHAGAFVARVEGVLLPGLINAHTHVELSWLRGALPPGAGFVPWVRAMVQARRSADPDTVRAAIDHAVDELFTAGTAAVGDIGNTTDARDVLARRGIAGWAFDEIVGIAPDGGVADLDRVSALPEARAPMRNGLAPHALYSTPAATVRAIGERARARGVRLSLHLAETADERAFLHDRRGAMVDLFSPTPLDFATVARGDSPVALADALGLVASDVLVVHLANARRPELDLVAARGAHAVLCPRSNLYIQTLLPPLLDVLAAGLLPALGTDSLASNTSLDVMAEAQALHVRFPSVPPALLLSMATAWGADALGLPHLGRLALGAGPGVLLVAAPPHRPIADPFAHVLASAPAVRRWLVPPRGLLA